MRKILPLIMCGGVASLYGMTGTIKKDVTIRETPSNKGKEVEDIRKNKTIEIIRKVDGGKYGYWYETPKGYIYNTFITLNEEPIVKIEENQTETIKSEPKTQIEIAPIVEVVIPPVIVVPLVTKNDEVKKETTIQPIAVMTKTNQIEPTPPQEVKSEPLPMKANFDYASSLENEPEIKHENILVDSKEDTKIVKKEILKNFIGISLNFNTLTVNKTNQVGDIVLNKPLDDKATSFTFQVGTKLKENYVVSANYEITNLDDLKLSSYYLSLDYQFNYEFINPYLGISLGMSDLQWQYDPLVSSQVKDEKLSSPLYSIQGGIVFPIEKQWSVFSQLSYQKLDFKTTFTSTPAKATVTHEDKRLFGIGVRYAF
ncbi:MAG: hypothetical protein PHF17_10645 [Arcobacteraceae bacterium]|nr:hypothetical protein [Arcobacteraceae bacterium]